MGRARVITLPMNTFFCSTLLDPHREGLSRSSALALGSWLSAIKLAGFDGLELWDNHYLQASASDQTLFARCDLPIKVLKTQVDPAQDPAGLISRAEMARKLGAEKLVFNLASLLDDPEYIRLVLRRAAVTFKGGRLVCECKHGSAFQDPQDLLGLYSDFEEAPFDLLIHPFIIPSEILVTWLALFKGRVTHAHVGVKQDGTRLRFAALAEEFDRVHATIKAMRGHNYRGTFSIEYTPGDGAADENPFALFASAKSDMDTLRRAWTVALPDRAALVDFPFSAS